MKANAPEKIYIFENPILDFTKLSVRQSDTDIEYTRTDAFIEKAATWIANRYQTNGSYLCADDIDDFRKYMKGDKPKFKIGDCIKPIEISLGSPRTICEVRDSWYVTNQGTLDFEFEDNWELVEEPVSEPQVKESLISIHDDKTCKEKSNSLTQEPTIPDIVDEHFYEMLGLEPVSEELEKVVEEIVDPTVLNAYGVKEIANRLRRTMIEPVSEKLEEAANEIVNKAIPPLAVKYKDGTYVSRIRDCFDRKEFIDLVKAGAKWQKTKDESTTEDLGEYINELSKQFPEVSFAKLSRIAVRVAKWQKQHLWKPADGDNLPEIDREVIALLDNGKIVFAHRPPEFWDGKNIVTGKVTRNYPKTYDKGGWNIPNVKYWLDCLMLKEIEL